jgi:AcrR family transcriptional regulator
MSRSGDDTRNGLVTAAKNLYHRQGFHRTTLADVAAASEIPLGSVYYHFRTKEMLAQAVIGAHAQDIRSRFAEWDLLPDPRQRLKMLLASSAHYKGVFARYGCPYGTLAVELDKDEGDLVEPVGGLLQLYLTWVAQQYRALGAGDGAEAAATRFVATLQGAYLLANALRNPELLEAQTQELAAAVDRFTVDGGEPAPRLAERP